MNSDLSDRRLSVPSDVASDDGSLELISVWFSKGKAKMLTRSGTALDDRPNIWAEIIAGIIENIAQHVAERTGGDALQIERTLVHLITEAQSK